MAEGNYAASEVLSVYLVRHAESMNNSIHTQFGASKLDKFLRFPDPNLSERGFLQVDKLRVWCGLLII